MEKLLLGLVIGLLLQVPTFSQGVLTFDINFGTNAPPHTPGDPVSGAILSNNWFYAILFLDTTQPVAGAIEELSGGAFTPVFQFTNLVFATYPGGGPAYDYEGIWPLTGTQIQSLLAGQWYAQVSYTGANYLGQITPVPEPSTLAVLLAGMGLVWAGCRVWRVRSAESEEPVRSDPATKIFPALVFLSFSLFRIPPSALDSLHHSITPPPHYSQLRIHP